MTMRSYLFAAQEAAAERLRPKQASPFSPGVMVYLTLLTIVAIALRVAWIVLTPNTPVSDFAYYYQFGQMFARGVFPAGTTFQGAGYPLILSFAFRLSGSTNIIYGKVENVIFSTLTLLVCYYVFAKLTSSRSILLISSTICAILPAWIAYNSVLGTEVFFTFCLMVAVALLLSSLPWMAKYPLLGITVGIAALTKPYIVVFPLLAAIIVWLMRKDLKDAGRLLVLSSICMLLTIAPVTWMNYRVTHRFLFNTDNGGYVLFINDNSDNVYGGWMSPADIHITPQLRQALLARGVTYPNLPIEDPAFAAIDPLLTATAEHWIITHPTQFVELGLMRVHNTYFSSEWDLRGFTANGLTDAQVNQSRGWKVLFDLGDFSFVTLNVAGFAFIALGGWQALGALLRRDRRLPAWIALPTLLGAFNVVVFFATEGQPRYAVPLEGLFAFSLAYLLTEIGRLMTQVTRSTQLTPQRLDGTEQRAITVAESTEPIASDPLLVETLKTARARHP